MGKLIGGWVRSAVYDPANGDTVQFNKLDPESCDFNHPAIQNETASGQIYGGRDIELIVGFFESDGLAQLKTWQEDGTTVQAVVEGESQDVLFHISEEMDFERGVLANARDGVAGHIVTLITVGEAPPAVPILNIASNSDIFTGDSDTFPFPIEGATIKAAADYASVTTPVDLVIEARDYGTDGTDGSVLASDTTSVTGAGRFTASVDLPANTYAVFVNFASNTGSATITNKTIRSDGGTAYEDH